MGIFENAIEKIVDVKQIKSSWYFEKLAQFCQANHFMTGWGLGVKQMRNMTREEITRWWKHRQDVFEASFLKRMTYFKDEVEQSFLPLLPSQMKVRKMVDKQYAKLDADRVSKKAAQQAKKTAQEQRNKTTRLHHAIHEQRPKTMRRKKPVHSTIRNGQEMEVV